MSMNSLNERGLSREQQSLVPRNHRDATGNNRLG